MYRVSPKSINTKNTDRDIEDGFLQESINLQWRDDALRPIPERLISTIDVSGYTNIILHKVSDENQINVLGFEIGSTSLGGDLALDIAGYLGGGSSQAGYLKWIGEIVDGVYTAKTTPITITEIVKTDGMSFTILNGLVYFMGDGSASDEQYYLRLQYNISDDVYETKNMYAWKNLIPFYPVQSNVNLIAPRDSVNVFSQCGLIPIRIALVLNSGEIVLHSPIYNYFMYGLNRSDAQIDKDTIIQNIHTFINLDFEFSDSQLFDEEISAINIYAGIPYYETKLKEDYATGGTNAYYNALVVDDSTAKGELQQRAEKPFYLVKTIDAPTDDKLLLTVDELDSDITYNGTYSKVDVATIAAGEIMPVDNFTYHELFGKITSFNGRQIVEKPKTILSEGHIRSLALEEVISEVGFKINTEDGNIDGIAYQIDKALRATFSGGINVHCRGLLSYPDAQASYAGGGYAEDSIMYLYKCRKNVAHNISCAFNMKDVRWNGFGVLGYSTSDLITETDYYSTIVYDQPDILIPRPHAIVQAGYISENRAQFSSPGEFSVWPAANSYRIGEGKILNIGFNSVDPRDADITAPLIVGTSDGVYTINFDPTGNNLVASITKTANTPYISEETLLVSDEKLKISGMILFVSDKGLMAINNGDVINLTEDFFPEQGNGDFPDPNTVYPNYNTLTNAYFGGSNPYALIDIVDYMKDAIFAYDARRNSIWCCNSSKNFSMIFNLRMAMWGLSTTVFSEKTELFSLLNTAEGDIYSRYLVKSSSNNNLLILSGEDPDTEVIYHMLTRPIKMQYPNNYKKLKGLFSRCELFRAVAATGYFSFGAWGKQDHNKKKVSIPITAKSDSSASVYPNNVRQDIPIGWSKGKYKSVVILQGGQTLPDSSIDSIDFDALLVNEIRTR
jgi:hypothetical protein